MSTRDDARLSPQERAALASLEAAAVADDPQLAARLKGSNRRLRSLLPIPPAFLLGKWRSLLRHGWWGGPVAVVGIVMILLGLPFGMPLSLVGVAAACIGLRLVAQAVDDRLRRPAPPA